MKPFKSFYSRISLIFLLLVLAFGAGSLIIAFTAAGHLFDEVEQLLNREYASSIAEELRPLLREGFTEAGIRDAIHYMMVLNPMVEIYLLDESGNVMAYFTHPEEEIVRERIKTVPIEEFIASDGRIPVLGDDPRTGDREKPFSAARLNMGDDEGYVYVILRGERYDRTFGMLRSSYYLRSGLTTFILALAITVSLGLVLFFFLTRRLNKLGGAVQAFERGEYGFRTDVLGTDEIGTLGKGFNEMAASVESGIRKLREVERQRTELITNISHDLRSPLTAVSGFLETIMLKDEKLSREERREFLEAGLRNVSSLRKLVEELFELVRFETDQVTRVTERFEAAELTHDVVMKLGGKAGEKGITMTVDRPEGGIPMEGDIGMIERLLTNLLENAVMYTPPGGSVRVVLERNRNEVEIRVTDTGPGIAEEDLPHLFERFFRTDRSRDRKIPGTGLGLAIAKEIVELHGGTIEAGNNPGNGAVFRITLPQA